MAITTFSSREFNQDVGRAKRAAKRGPVIVTDRGRASHVLLTIEEYRVLTGKGRSLVEMLTMPGADQVEFEPPRLGDDLVRPADFS